MPLQTLFVFALFATDPTAQADVTEAERVQAARSSMIAEIAAANTDSQERQSYSIRFHQDGSLKYLGGGSLPFDCRLPTEPDDKDVDDFVACVFENARPLLKDSTLDAPARAQWRVERAVTAKFLGTNIDHIIVKVQQHIDGLPVRGGKATISVLNGELMQFNGRLFGGDRLETAAAAEVVRYDAENVAVQAEMELGSDAFFVDRYYDPERHTTISRFALSCPT